MIELKLTCPVAPVQIEAVDDEDGMHYYFRSRHGQWTFSKGKPVILPVFG